MESAARILLIATAMFMNTECFRTFEKRQDSCQEDIVNCAPSVFDGSIESSLNSNFGTLAPNIDQICSSYHTGKECAEQVFESCENYDEENELQLPRLDFICSDQGKSLLREFQQSVCYNNFPNFWRDCTSEIRDSSEDSRRSRVRHCVISAFTGTCGAAGGTILASLI